MPSSNRPGRQHGPVVTAATTATALLEAGNLPSYYVPKEIYRVPDGREDVERWRKDSVAADGSSPPTAAAAVASSLVATSRASSQRPSSALQKRKRSSVVGDFSRKAFRRMSESSLGVVGKRALRRVSESPVGRFGRRTARRLWVSVLGSLVSWFRGGDGHLEPGEEQDGDGEDGEMLRPPFWPDRPCFEPRSAFSDSSEDELVVGRDLVERADGEGSLSLSPSPSLLEGGGRGVALRREPSPKTPYRHAALYEGVRRAPDVDTPVIVPPVDAADSSDDRAYDADEELECGLGRIHVQGVEQRSLSSGPPIGSRMTTSSYTSPPALDSRATTAADVTPAMSSLQISRMAGGMYNAEVMDADSGSSAPEEERYISPFDDEHNGQGLTNPTNQQPAAMHIEYARLRVQQATRTWLTDQELAVRRAVRQGQFDEALIDDRFREMSGNCTTAEEQRKASDRLLRDFSRPAELSWGRVDGSAAADSDDE